MDWNFKHADTRLLLTATGLLALVAGVTNSTFGFEAAVLATLVLAFAGLFGLLLNVYRTRAKDDVAHNEHLQGLMHLFSMLDDVRAPLPMLTGWAASPQLAGTLVTLLREHQPSTIVELGSGSSTLVLGYAAEQAGTGHVIALDHLEPYGEHTQAQIRRHDLEDWAEVRHAPLTDVELDGETWSWYDLDALDASPEVASIDLLLVDGPPHETRPQARYPAVPMLIDRLSDDAIVVLDDAYREDEASIAAAWADAYGFDLHLEDSPYGTAVLRRMPNA